MFVYLITNAVNGKRYVGITTATIDARWRRHVSHAKGGGKQALACAIRKHGVESFSVRQLEECVDEAILRERERHWIRELSTLAPVGYNLTEGGEGVFGYRHTEECRRRFGAKLRGKNRGPKSPETRARMSAAKKGRKFTPEHLVNLRAAKRRPVSEETKQRLSTAASGRVLSDEARARISASSPQRRRVEQLTLAGEPVAVHESMNAGAKAAGCLPQNVSQACRGKIRSAGGFRWRYVESTT